MAVGEIGPSGGDDSSSPNRQEEPWYHKPLRKGWAEWAPPGVTRPGANLMEWAGRPTRPITASELDHFGDDAFDLDDKFAEGTMQRMKEDLEKRKAKSTSKEPDDLEDYQFTTVQDVSDYLTAKGQLLEDDKLP